MNKKEAAKTLDEIAKKQEVLAIELHVVLNSLLGITKENRGEEKEERFESLNEREQQAVLILNEQGWRAWWGMDLVNVDGSRSNVGFAMVKEVPA